jgi:hypothetical protein
VRHWDEPTDLLRTEVLFATLAPLALPARVGLRANADDVSDFETVLDVASDLDDLADNLVTTDLRNNVVYRSPLAG